MRVTMKTLALATSIAVVPTAAGAQAIIAGTVKDTSGAVLPGVTVEAASPALIEKVRTATTDSTGQYRIVDLRPGAYTVIFSLQGFSALRREGIELTGTFTATVNVELTVGTRGRDGRRHRRKPDRRCPERAAADDAERRGRQGHSDGSQLQRVRGSRAWRRHQHQRRGDRTGRHHVPDSRRSQRRGPPAGGWTERGESARRQSTADLSGGRRQRSGGQSSRPPAAWASRRPRA